MKHGYLLLLQIDLKNIFLKTDQKYIENWKRKVILSYFYIFLVLNFFCDWHLSIYLKIGWGSP